MSTSRILLLVTSMICIKDTSATNYCTTTSTYTDDFVVVECSKVQFPLETTELVGGTSFFRRIWLKIKESNLSEIESSSFITNSIITDLDLSQNNITNIKQDAFAGLSSLRKLFLARNALSELKPNVFDSLQQLRTLDVSMNNIKKLDLNFLTDIIHLSYLNLSKNSLAYFNDAVLGQNHYILELKLNDNQISQLILNRSSHRIANLDVSKNRLTVVDICIPGLLSLNISYNNIVYLLSGKCLINMTINNLDASHNFIDDFSVKNISKLWTLKILRIGYNDISLIPNGLFVNMTELTYLDLSNNKLLKLQYGIFDNLFNLKYLDLSYNKLKSLKRYFYSLHQLDTLKINNNEIVYTHSNPFSDLPNLRNIYLNNNKFDCKQLLEVLNGFKQVNFDSSTVMGKENIHGITCLDYKSNSEIEDDLTGYFKKIISSKFEKPDDDDDFKRTMMYNYFNKDFLNSNFYKYLENFKTNNVHKDDTLKFLKSELDNSKFYQFLESLQVSENSTREFGKYIEEYLEKLKLDLEEKLTLRDNDINEQIHAFSETNNKTSYYGMFSAIILIIFMLLLIKIIQIYIEYIKNKHVRKEELQLLDQVQTENRL
ncbi:toll-like receptor 7 [Diorhabda carinulata]|uniref:toll-like receptor 7 n=1 Tax=Diorhabda carinulata TaxID=1163345 RepID=UPI0025A2F8FD|nr:toll-like receptor 7 [Diorhabda carinulata]